MASLTAQDIAKHIQRPGEPLAAAVDRLRNWTKMGIIKPVGARHPGTGRKKQYSSVALAEALLLQALTDALGSSAVSLRPLIDKVTQLGEYTATVAEIYEEDRKTGGIFKRQEWWKSRPELIVLTRHRKDGPFDIHFPDAGGLDKQISKSDADIHIVINMKSVLGRVAHSWEGAFEELMQNREKQTKKRKS